MPKLSGAALTPAVLSRGGSPFWAILGWAAMSVLGAVGGCLLVSRHGRPGPAFLVVLGSSMLCRLVVAAAGLVAGTVALLSHAGAQPPHAGLDDGSLPAALQEVMALVEPEAVYIGPDGGERCAMIFFDLDESSDIPAVTEPLFQKVNASVEILPVMNQDDLRAGLTKLG